MLDFLKRKASVNGEPNYVWQFWNGFAGEAQTEIEWIEAGDAVWVNLPGAVAPFVAVVMQTRPEIQYALVEDDCGVQRWVSVNEIELLFKAMTFNGVALIATEAAISA